MSSGNTSHSHLVIKAGILPFAISPHRHQLAVLLGKIAPACWVRSKVLHTDFGGRAQHADASLFETAAREFLEETLGQVSLPNCADMSVKGIANFLQGGNYFAKIMTTRRKKKKQAGDDACSVVHACVTFLVHIPFNPEIQKTYSEYRNRLLSCCRSLRPGGVADMFASKQPALERVVVSKEENRYRMRKSYTEIEGLNFFGLEYLNHICQNKTVQKRISLLHNTRLRFLTLVQVLLKLQQETLFKLDDNPGVAEEGEGI